MVNFSEATMELEFFGNISIYYGIGIQIIFALLLGGLVGYDREIKMKAAGFKTNIMICIGATLYTTISIIVLHQGHYGSMVDPNRVPAQIVSGIGFLGAGAIIQGRGSVTGLTTAAAIWVVAAIGYTIGVGYPIVATFFSVTVLIVLRVLNPINSLIESKKDHKSFHLEILSYGSMDLSTKHIIEMEDVIVVSTDEEDYPQDLSMKILNVYIEGHYRALERIHLEIADAIKTKKVNHREILKFPNVKAKS